MDRNTLDSIFNDSSAENAEMFFYIAACCLQTQQNLKMYHIKT